MSKADWRRLPPPSQAQCCMCSCLLTSVCESAVLRHQDYGALLCLLILLLQHTWNQYNSSDTQTPAQLCAAQTGQDYANPQSIGNGWTDGVRDTPPQTSQMPAMSNNKDGSMLNGPIFFRCNADGTFDPQAPAMQPQAPACNGSGLTGGKYFNNFYNIMSYYGSSVRSTDSCKRQKHRHTFTAGQIARMQRVWRCYRLN